jgi:ABC-type transport system involved in multi-copper enzyme maturation permease subunit
MRTRVISSIALNTYRESVRSKVLYSFFFFAVVMVIIASAFSTSTIGENILILKDFGLFIVSIASIGFVVVSGSSLLAKELQKRTVFNMLAKPVYRSEFLLGKYLGMVATGTALIILMSGGLFVMLWLLEGEADILIIQASFFLLLELAIICAAAIFFSSIVVTPMLTGMFT